jgi:predicted AAA+ superfamily ATPase
MIERPRLIEDVERSLKANPVVALMGPRQCGKTTLAHMIADRNPKCEFFDLENPVHLSRLSAPMQALESLSGLVVIDEIQRKPELFELIRVLVDRPDNAAIFLVLGSASPDLVKGTSESLAGRVGFIDMSGFDLDEVGHDTVCMLWNRGGLPRSYLANDDETSYAWRQDFIRTFLERDIPQLGISIPAQTLRHFWTMIAHYHGQIWNGAEFARSMGTSEPSVRRYLDILCGAYMVRALQPWYENLKKRQVKSSKIYLRDTGLLHGLLSIESYKDLQMHPKLGGSWEGFVIEYICRVASTRDIYFWATHTGAELDLLIFKKGRRYGFEVKYTDAPRMTKSIRIAVNDLLLHKVFIIYPGKDSYDLDKNIHVIPMDRICSAIYSMDKVK